MAPTPCDTCPELLPIATAFVPWLDLPASFPMATAASFCDENPALVPIATALCPWPLVPALFPIATACDA